jgi:hypothetical protein
MPQRSGRGDALRKEKALLHTFVTGQKYGVGRDELPFLFFKKSTRATVEPPVALSLIETPSGK